ncbi:hypothetical protein Tco_1025939 [Tanacetum coccineum]
MLSLIRIRVGFRRRPKHGCNLYLSMPNSNQQVIVRTCGRSCTGPVELVPTSAAGRQRSAPLTASDAGSEHVGSSSVKLQGCVTHKSARNIDAMSKEENGIRPCSCAS